MKKNILLVEYATSTIDLIKELLSHPIFNITVLNEGDIAKKALNETKFDMLITAAMLPKFHGFNLSQFASTNCPGIKIIIISEIYKGMDYKHQAVSLYKADDFFEKPFNNNDFKNRVLELLDIKPGDIEETGTKTTAQIPIPDTAKIPTLKKIEEEEAKLTSEDIFGDIIKKVEDTSSFEIKLDGDAPAQPAPPKPKPPEAKKPDNRPPVVKPPDMKPGIKKTDDVAVTQKIPTSTQVMTNSVKPAPPTAKPDTTTRLMEKTDLNSHLKKATTSTAASQKLGLDLDSLLKNEPKPKKEEKDKFNKIEADISKRFEETLSGLGIQKPQRKQEEPVVKPTQPIRVQEKPVPVVKPEPPVQPPTPAPPEMKVTEVIQQEEEKDEVGGYDILGLIARGGMAEIYKAKKRGVKGFEKVIALKKILAGYGKDDKYVEMFVDEAKIAAELTHPNIVQIYDLGKKDDYYFIAMEYVRGKDLRLILRKLNESNQLLPEPISVYLVLEVLKALNYAHTAKSSDGKNLDIVHRDISPPNILVSYVGDVKLTDFGVSKASIKMHHTVAGALKGKLLYMSPEQAKAEKDVDYRSDLYAVGIILYELITGEKLFFAPSEVGILQKVQSGDVPKPSLIRKDIDHHLEIILMRMLNKDKNKRYQKASDIIGDLRDYLQRKFDNMPTAIHLSHAICDLFKEEIAKEDTRIDIKPLPYRIKKKEMPSETPVEKPVKEEEEILRLDEDSIIQPESASGISMQVEEEPPVELEKAPLTQDEEVPFQPLIEIDLDGEEKEEPVAEIAEPIHSAPIKTDFRHMETEFQKKKKFLFILLALVVVLGAVVIFVLLTGSPDEKSEPATQPQTGITETTQGEKTEPTVETEVNLEDDLTEPTGAAKTTTTEQTTPAEQTPVQKKAPEITEKEQAASKPPVQTTVPTVPGEKEQPTTKQEKTAEPSPTPTPPAETTTVPTTTTEVQKPQQEPAKQEQMKQEPAKQEPVQKKPEVTKPVVQQAPVKKAVLEGDTVSINEVDAQPVPLSKQTININPSYTRSLQSSMENVFVTYLIDHEGKVETVRIIKKSSAPRINALIEKAISRWRFKPALKNNVRVKVWKTVSLTIKK